MKNKTMLVLLLFAMISVVIICIISFTQNQQRFSADVKQYLETKYGRSVIVLKYIPEYHGAPAIEVCFEDEPEVSFISYPNLDFYLITHLEDEAVEILKEIFPGYRISASISWIPFEESEIQRMAFYQEHNRPLSWADTECQERIDQIFMSSSEYFDQNEANTIANEIVSIFSSNLDDSIIVTLTGENCKYCYRLSPERKPPNTGDGSLC